MKKTFTLFILLSLLFSSVGITQDHNVYAVTAISKEANSWVALRKLDLKTGAFSDVLINGADQNTIMYDAVSKKQAVLQASSDTKSFNPRMAFGSGVAALAFDRKNSRLYYTPMFADQLRYIDLTTMRVYVVSSQSFAMNNFKSSRGNPLTRMVIAGDGYGYIIPNDGNHLFRFTTEGNPVISDLGELVDDPLNNELTIHSACANAGGDMVADNSGNLYLITAGRRVYKIEIESRDTKYLGSITGLPDKYYSNGAAVADNGKILVGSSVNKEGLYEVNPETWEATPYPTNGFAFRSSDLASSNLINTKRSTPVVSMVTGNGQIKIFPNPVVNSRLNVQFDNFDIGRYSIILSDVLGKQLFEKVINISLPRQTESMNLSLAPVQGIYFIRVLNHESKMVFNKKLIFD